jgi:hypothetical protein
METAQRIQAIKSRSKVLNNLAAELNQTMKHEKANSYLLDPARINLRNVEMLLVQWADKAPIPDNASMFLDIAEFDLGQAAGRLKYAQEMVKKYGAGIQAIGG